MVAEAASTEGAGAEAKAQQAQRRCESLAGETVWNMLEQHEAHRQMPNSQGEVVQSLWHVPPMQRQYESPATEAPAYQKVHRDHRDDIGRSDEAPQIAPGRSQRLARPQQREVTALAGVCL